MRAAAWRRRKQPKIRQLEFYVISAQERVKTHTDYEGGLSPSWNEKMCLEIEENLLEKESLNSQLTFDIYCHGSGCWGRLGRDKLVGTVRISLIDAVKPGANPYPITTYLIFTPDGDSQGLLNVCVPPNGRFPKRLDSLSFKRVESNNGVQLEAVPSFKENMPEDESEAIASVGGSSAVAGKSINRDNEELGIYDDAFFDASAGKS